MHTVICLSSLFFCSWYVTSATADLYQWTDVNGVLHIVDEAVGVPDQYRDELTVYHVAEAQDPPEPAPLPLSPSRTYATYSQGAFAQKLALDLGLIKSDKEDALGPLRGGGLEGGVVAPPSGASRLRQEPGKRRFQASQKRLLAHPDCRWDPLVYRLGQVRRQVGP